ncbi:MAG: ABC transporter permease subunit [Anaerolineales bacterium]|nr:ABC transporter permease subunit [Anaerolineales bacterium]HEY61291.1 ABC transporter permease subunit [Anaerolineae bacterium]
MMRNIWTIAKREYRLYFSTPMAYMISFLFFLVLGVLFYSNLLAYSYQQYAPSINIVVGPIVTLFIFVTPAITMRLIAAEQGMGTIELLLTAPVRDWELIVGKWFGGLLFVLTLLAGTLIYPLLLNQLITPGIDQGKLVTSYLGLFLIAASLISLGVAISTLFKNQNAAFFSTLGAVLLLWLLGAPAEASGSIGSNILRYLDFRSHFYNTLYQGVIDLSDLTYYLSLTALFLFLGTIIVETRRWR